MSTGNSHRRAGSNVDAAVRDDAPIVRRALLPRGARAAGTSRASSVSSSALVSREARRYSRALRHRMTASASMLGRELPRGDRGDAVFDAEYLDQHRDAHPHAVALLPPVHRAGILSTAGSISAPRGSGCMMIASRLSRGNLRASMLNCARSMLRDSPRRVPFRLHARHVERVERRQRVSEPRRLRVRNAVLVEMRLDVALPSRTARAR